MAPRRPSDEHVSGDLDPVELELRDRRRVTVRAVHPDDAEKLREAIRSLSPESQYARFFSPFRELPPRLVERATHPEPGRELQLFAVSGQGADEKIVAGARYVAVEGTHCEFAVAVIDAWHGFGLARRLMEILMRHAHSAGFTVMDGYVLTANTRMLALAKRLDFTESASSEGPTVRMVRRGLGPPAAPP